MKRIDKISSEVSVLLPQIARRVLLEFFQSVQLTQTQIFTIMALADKSPLKVTEISAIMQISTPTVSGIVDRLVKQGHLKRERDKKDRRVINVSLSPKGKAVARKFRSTIKRKWKDLLVNLPKRDQEHFLRILKKVQGGMI